MDNIRGTKNGHEFIPLEETEDYKAHKRAMERLKSMTREERFQTLVDAGIYTQERELTERYGGTAPNQDD